MTNERKRLGLAWDGILASVIALALPYPGGHGYSPISIALWVFLTDDVGHGTREFWITVALAVTAVYALIVFFLIRGVAFSRG